MHWAAQAAAQILLVQGGVQALVLSSSSASDPNVQLVWRTPDEAWMNEGLKEGD